MRLVNAIPDVVEGAPGLLTALDLPRSTAGAWSAERRLNGRVRGMTPIPGIRP